MVIIAAAPSFVRVVGKRPPIYIRCFGRVISVAFLLEIGLERSDEVFWPIGAFPKGRVSDLFLPWAQLGCSIQDRFVDVPWFLLFLAIFPFVSWSVAIFNISLVHLCFFEMFPMDLDMVLPITESPISRPPSWHYTSLQSDRCQLVSKNELWWILTIHDDFLYCIYSKFFSSSKQRSIFQVWTKWNLKSTSLGHFEGGLWLCSDYQSQLNWDLKILNW